ncbi:30S ribosomal protein S16 [bacterium]|nr:30S ribosomal protein S16 [bacterium]
MATKLRLRREGTKNVAAYRLVVTDMRSPRDGRFIEILGHYNPHKGGKEKLTVNTERATYWIGTGAQVSPAVRSLLKLAGVTVPAPKSHRKGKPKTEAAAPAAQ